MARRSIMASLSKPWTRKFAFQRGSSATAARAAPRRLARRSERLHPSHQRWHGDAVRSADADRESRAEGEPQVSSQTAATRSCATVTQSAPRTRILMHPMSGGAAHHHVAESALRPRRPVSERVHLRPRDQLRHIRGRPGAGAGGGRALRRGSRLAHEPQGRRASNEQRAGRHARTRAAEALHSRAPAHLSDESPRPTPPIRSDALAHRAAKLVPLARVPEAERGFERGLTLSAREGMRARDARVPTLGLTAVNWACPCALPVRTRAITAGVAIPPWLRFQCSRLSASAWPDS